MRLTQCIPFCLLVSVDQALSSHRVVLPYPLLSYLPFPRYPGASGTAPPPTTESVRDCKDRAAPGTSLVKRGRPKGSVNGGSTVKKPARGKKGSIVQRVAPPVESSASDAAVKRSASDAAVKRSASDAAVKRSASDAAVKRSASDAAVKRSASDAAVKRGRGRPPGGKKRALDGADKGGSVSSEQAAKRRKVDIPVPQHPVAVPKTDKAYLPTERSQRTRQPPTLVPRTSVEWGVPASMQLLDVSSRTFGADLTHTENMVGGGGRFLEALCMAAFHAPAAEAQVASGKARKTLMKNLKRFYALLETLANEHPLSTDKRATALLHKFPAYAAQAEMEIAAAGEDAEGAEVHEPAAAWKASPRPATAHVSVARESPVAPATSSAGEVSEVGADVANDGHRIYRNAQQPLSTRKATRSRNTAALVPGSLSKQFTAAEASGVKAGREGIARFGSTPLPMRNVFSTDESDSDSSR